MLIKSGTENGKEWETERKYKRNIMKITYIKKIICVYLAFKSMFMYSDLNYSYIFIFINYSKQKCTCKLV